MNKSLEERALKAIVLTMENFAINNATHESPGNEVYMLAKAYASIATADDEEKNHEE